jgi:hypothetical protein
MSRTVGVPAAIGAQMILDGKLQAAGVIVPISRDIYEPVGTRRGGEANRLRGARLRDLLTLYSTAFCSSQPSCVE